MISLAIANASILYYISSFYKIGYTFKVFAVVPRIRAYCVCTVFAGTTFNGNVCIEFRFTMLTAVVSITKRKRVRTWACNWTYIRVNVQQKFWYLFLDFTFGEWYISVNFVIIICHRNNLPSNIQVWHSLHIPISVAPNSA